MDRRNDRPSTVTLAAYARRGLTSTCMYRVYKYLLSAGEGNTFCNKIMKAFYMQQYTCTCTCTCITQYGSTGYIGMVHGGGLALSVYIRKLSFSPSISGQMDSYLRHCDYTIKATIG